MNRKLNIRNSNRFLLVFNVILAIALIVALVFGLLGGKKSDPAIIVDGELIMAIADDFNVSIEFLQTVLPDYLVYSVAGEYRFQKLDPRLPRHDYDLTLLARDERGRAYYADENYPQVTYGVDVSQYQGQINWPLVAADGVDFAMIRVGYRGYGSGKTVPDENFVANIEGALAAGLDVGVYYFSQAITEEEAKEEARIVLDAVEGYPLTMPVVFDMEEIYNESARTDALDKETATAIALAFCQTVKKAGYQPMIYGNTKWLAGRLDLPQLRKYPIWFAQYHTRPLLPYDFAMWQYTNNGAVAGIDNAVDLNICFKKPQ